jgi:hypothetical protein
MSAMPETRNRSHLKHSRRFWVMLGVTILVAGSALTGVVWAATSQAGFTGEFSTVGTNCGYGCVEVAHSISFPSGREVAFQWADQSGGLVRMGIVSPNGTNLPQCQWNEVSHGSCSFVSVGGSYPLGAENSPGTAVSQTIHYSVTYPNPML